MGSSSETVQKKNESKTTAAIAVLKSQFEPDSLKGLQGEAEASQTENEPAEMGVNDVRHNYKFRAFDYLTGMFKSSIDFNVRGTEVKGKDQDDISVAPIPLFKGAVLDLSSTKVKGNARGKQRWIEGYGGSLVLLPPGSTTIKKVKLLSFWIGVKNSDQQQGSVVLQTAEGTTLDYKKAHYKTDMLWMNDGEPDSVEQKQLHMVGVREVGENGEELEGTTNELGVLGESYARKGEDKTKPDFAAVSNERVKVEKEKEKKTEETRKEVKKKRKKVKKKRKKVEEKVIENKTAQNKVAKPVAGAVAESVPEDVTKIVTGGVTEPAPGEVTETATATGKVAVKDAVDTDTANSEPQEDEKEILKTLVDVAKDKLLKTDEKEGGSGEEKTMKQKVDQALGVIKSIKPGKELNLDDDDDDDSDGMSLPLAKVSIFPPFIWADVTLEGELEHDMGIDPQFDASNFLSDYKEKVGKLKEEIIKDANLAHRVAEESTYDNKIKMVENALIPTDISASAGIAAYVKVNGSIGIRLGVGAGIPTVLTITAGVFGNIGVSGTLEDDKCLKGSANVDVNLNIPNEKISLSNMKFELQGGFKFTAGAGVDITLESEIFGWKKNLFEFQKEANLFGLDFGAILINNRTISSEQGPDNAIRDFWDGWYLESTDLTPSGVIYDFLKKNPKEKRFNLISGNALSMPLDAAEKVIGDANTLLNEVKDPKCDNSTKLETNMHDALGKVEESKKNLEELQKKIDNNESCQENLKKLAKLVKHHEENKKLLEAIINGNSSETYKMKDQADKQDFDKFRKRQSEEQAKREIATYENIDAYEKAREHEHGKKHEERIQLLMAKLEELNITEADMDKKNMDFVAYYKTLSSSEFTKNIALESDLDELRIYEQKRAYENRKDFQKRIDMLLKKMKNVGLENVPKVHYAAADVEWKVDLWEAKTIEGKKYREIWEYYKNEMEGDALQAEMGQFLNREDLKAMLYSDLKKEKKGKDDDKWQFKTSASSINTYNHLAMAVMLSSYMQNFDEIGYEKIHEPYKTAGLFDYYSQDPDFWLVKMGKDAMKAYENAAELKYLLAYEGKDKNKNGENSFQKAIEDDVQVGVNLILAYEKHKGGQSISAFEKHLEAIESEQNVNYAEIRTSIKNYMKKEGGGFIKFLKEGDRKGIFDFKKTGGGDKLDNTGKYLERLNKRLREIMPEDAIDKDVEKHMARLARINDSKGDMYDVWMDYRNEKDEDGKYQDVVNYYDERIKQRFDDEKNKTTGHDLTLEQWYAFEKLKLEKNKEKEWGALPEEVSKIRLFEILYEGADDEAALNAYHKLAGNAPAKKLSEEELAKYVKPDMILKFECAQANRAAQKHIHRLKIIDQGGTFDEIVNRYRDQVNQDHMINKVKTFFRIHVGGGFEKFLKKAGREFDPTPRQILKYENDRKETVTKKHTLRRNLLNSDGSDEGRQRGAELYMKANAKGFLRSRKNEIKERAEKLRKGPATNEQKLQFHEEQLSHAQEMFNDASGPIDELKNKIAILSKLLAELKAEYDKRFPSKPPVSTTNEETKLNDKRNI